MDLDEMISDLCSQRLKIDQAIASLEQLVSTRKRGRGRPRKLRAEAPPAGQNVEMIRYLAPKAMRSAGR